jgi:nucleoside-diphosphate-sugar epimerase
MAESHLLIFGLGYSGMAVARLAQARGVRVTGTSRSAAAGEVRAGVSVQPFAAALPADVTHVLATAAPEGGQDPVLAAHGAGLRALRGLRWAGYLSTTGVYGDRGGGWVDEATEVAPGNARSVARVAAEREWAGLADRVAVDLFRVAGIYGPGRSALEEVRAGRARRMVKPGHAFGRIHVDDIAGAVMAAVAQALPPGVRVLNLADDEPAANAQVVAEAAALLGVAAPPEVAFETAWAGMSAMGREFWAENRRVRSARTQEMLGYRWRYPSYREGLRGVLKEDK